MGLAAAAVLVLGACAGEEDAADEQAVSPSVNPSEEGAPSTTMAAPPTTGAAPPTTEVVEIAAPQPEPEAVAVMPDIPCGTDLQLAQDMVQEAGVFFSRSVDATGQGRYQVMDRNWTVVESQPPAGTPIGEDEAVFHVVKDDEFTGC